MPTLLEIYKYNILQGAGSMAFSKNITQYGPWSSFPYTHPSPTSASTGRTLKIIIKKTVTKDQNCPPFPDLHTFPVELKVPVVSFLPDFSIVL
jgi:hypothetical protein